MASLGVSLQLGTNLLSELDPGLLVSGFLYLSYVT